MRISKYPSGYQFEVSAENPQIFSANDINRFIELDNQLCRNKQDNAEWLRLKRSFARAVDCADCSTEVDGDILTITLY